MKNIIILHGWGESPNLYWFPYIKRHMEELGWSVSIPELPDTDNPQLLPWLERALQEQYDKDTVLIGHSMGCPLILSILERIQVPIAQAYLVAGFYAPLPTDQGSNPMLQAAYDWTRIRHSCGEFFFINSDNDPWSCDDRQARRTFERLKGILIVPHGEGHMGSLTYSQPYPEFPLLLKLLK